MTRTSGSNSNETSSNYKNNNVNDNGNNGNCGSNYKIRSHRKESAGCNSRGSWQCMLIKSCIVHKCAVVTQKTTYKYILHCTTTFKLQYYNHISPFKHKNEENETSLSNLIWQLREGRKTRI